MIIRGQSGAISAWVWAWVLAIVAGAAVFVTPVAGAVLLAPILLACVLVFPPLAVPALIVASSLSRLALPSGDTQIRLEIPLTLLLAAVLANRVAVRTLPLRALRCPLLLPLLAYIGVNVLSTVVFAAETTRGLKLDAEIVAAILAYVVVVVLVKDRVELERAMKTLWIVTVGEATLGILFLLAFIAHLASYGVQEGDFGLPMAYGTSWEANIFGSFLLGNFFLLLAHYLTRPRTPLRTWGLVIIVIAMASSETRTVWLGLLLGLAVFFALSGKHSISGSPLLAVVAALPVLALTGLVIGSATPLAGRLMDLVNLHSSSASGRFVIFNAAIGEWRHFPLLGTGTGSFNFGAIPGGAHPWLPNLLLLTLHDTGLVGITILVVLFASFFRYTYSSLSSRSDVSVLAAGSIAACCALLVAFQTTSGFWFAYPWIVLALGISAARLARVEA